MQLFADRIRQAVARATGVAADEIRIEQPRDPSLGDLAFPCFALAKSLKKAPPAIAAEVAAKLARDLPGIASVATGPYVNFKVDRAELARSVLGEIEGQGLAFGRSDVGKGKTVVVDLSSPNIAKP